MALTSASGLAAYSVPSGVKKLDLSEELAEIIRTDNTVLLNRTGIGHFVATQLTHKWVEDKLNPNTATLNTALADGTTTSVVVNTGEGARFKIGTIFKFNEKGKTEMCRVTDVSGDTLTVERGYGSTSGETHAAGAQIMIISHTKQEGWDPNKEDWSQERTGVYNYLTTMGYGITITRRRQAIDAAAIPSEFAHQSAYRLKEFMRALDSTVINSIRSASEGGASDYSSMGGLIEFVSQTGGNVVSTDEALSVDVMNDLVKQIWDDGGLVAGGKLVAIVGGVQKRKISTFDQAYRRLDYNANAVGYVVEKFMSDLGFEVEILVDPWVPDDTIIVGDINRLRIGPLQNDAVGLEDLAKRSRLIEAMLTGTYTCEVRNALEAWAIHTNLQS